MDKIDALMGAKFYQVLTWLGSLLIVAGIADLPWLPIHPGYRIGAIAVGIVLLLAAGTLAWIRAKNIGDD